ncbi:hypothetical protein [Streptomyces sodiiphilus]
MSPGEHQPGGGQGPQEADPGRSGAEQPNPYQQPGYQQPNPYTQPVYQQPNPYQQPTVGWQGPAAAPPPPGGSRKARTIIAVAVATAVVAAGVVTAVVVLGDDSANPSYEGQQTPAPEPEPSEEEALDDEDRAPDDPRRGPQDRPEPVVAPDWQVQTISKRYNAFDVPPDWKVNSEDYMVGFTDDREKEEEEPAEDEDEFSFEIPDLLVAMSAVATYKDNWCGHSSRAMAGTKGGQGATGTEEAARSEAVEWALSAWDQNQLGTLEVSDPEPFESEHGISGHTATALITGVPKDPDAECEAADGKVVTVSYLDARNDLATWVLLTDTGVDDEVDEETIEKMMNSLRPYPADS